MLHKYLSDLRLIRDWGNERPSLGQSEALRSHLDWVCSATTVWRKNQGGCDEVWRIAGAGRVTALGLLLGRPQSFAPATSDAAMDVLQTVCSAELVLSDSLIFGRDNDQTLGAQLKLSGRMFQDRRIAVPDDVISPPSSARCSIGKHPVHVASVPQAPF